LIIKINLEEKVIKIESIDPKDFFGPQNKNIKLIKTNFPDLKIVARGNQIKAFGKSHDLSELELRINKIISYFLKYNILSDNEIETLLTKTEKELETSVDSHKPILHGVSGRIIKARSLNQRKIIDSVSKNDMVFAIGPAGTGKTYTGIALAVKALKNKNIKKIILTRPAIEAGENLGFLPGDLKEKLDPYMQPLYDALKDMIPAEKLKKFLEDEVIQIAPLAFMRGRTLDNAFVILDEGQNTTHSQMKMFLTRMGKNAKFIITGDPGQVDLPRNSISGLKEAVLILKNTSGVGIVHLDETDVIRNKLVKKIVNAYTDIQNNN
tara:strand:- start:6791 stop:7759 length:969 start_codon:yes stop_codon:yes gene_type:complete